MTSVDNTIIYTALPSLARDFHASLAAAQWVTLSYLLALAVWSRRLGGSATGSAPGVPSWPL